MKITSNAFSHMGMIPEKYTCEGQDISPTIKISDPPSESESLAILMHDHDAKSQDFVHWIVWNIDPAMIEIVEGTIPIGAAEGTNDFPHVGWGGPCPPSGKHQYEFHLYALDTMLDLPETSKKEDFRSAIEGHILEEKSIIGLYEKS